MRLVSFNVNLFQIVLYLLLDLVLIFQKILQLVVLLHRLLRFQNLQQLVLLLNDVLNMSWFKVLINFSLCKMSSQLLCVVLILLLILLYLAIQAQIRMIVLLLIQFLREKWKNVNIWSLLNLNNHIESFSYIRSLNLKLYCLNRNQKFSDSVVDSCKSYLFCFECLLLNFILRF